MFDDGRTNNAKRTRKNRILHAIVRFLFCWALWSCNYVDATTNWKSQYSISLTYWKPGFIGTISQKIIRTIKYFLIFRFFSFFLDSRPDLKRNTQILLTLCIAFQSSFFIRTTNRLFVYENHKYTISRYDGWSWFRRKRFFPIEQHLWISIFYVQVHIPPSVIERLNTFFIFFIFFFFRLTT